MQFIDLRKVIVLTLKRVISSVANSFVAVSRTIPLICNLMENLIMFSICITGICVTMRQCVVCEEKRCV